MPPPSTSTHVPPSRWHPQSSGEGGIPLSGSRSHYNYSHYNNSQTSGHYSSNSSSRRPQHPRYGSSLSPPPRHAHHHHYNSGSNMGEGGTHSYPPHCSHHHTTAYSHSRRSRSNSGASDMKPRPGRDHRRRDSPRRVSRAQHSPGPRPSPRSHSPQVPHSSSCNPGLPHAAFSSPLSSQALTVNANNSTRRSNRTPIEQTNKLSTEVEIATAPGPPLKTPISSGASSPMSYPPQSSLMSSPLTSSTAAPTLQPPPPPTAPPSPRPNVGISKNEPSHPSWRLLPELQRQKRCLHCQSHHWTNSQTAVCNSCLARLPRVACTHCKIQFVQHDILVKAQDHFARPICLDCAKNITVNGEPATCSICKLDAAFSPATECARCQAFQRDYGAPHECQRCGVRAAFLREEASMKKVDNNLLCFECTIVYKRDKYRNSKLAAAGLTEYSSPSQVLELNKLRKANEQLTSQLAAAEAQLSQRLPTADAFEAAKRTEKENFFLKKDIEALKRQIGRDETQIAHLKSELATMEQRRDCEVEALLQENQDERAKLHDFIEDLKQKNADLKNEVELARAEASAARDKLHEEVEIFARYKVATERRVLRICHKFGKVLAKKEERLAQRLNTLTNLRKHAAALEEEKEKLLKIERVNLGLEDYDDGSAVSVPQPTTELNLEVATPNTKRSSHTSTTESPSPPNCKKRRTSPFGSVGSPRSGCCLPETSLTVLAESMGHSMPGLKLEAPNGPCAERIADAFATQVVMGDRADASEETAATTFATPEAWAWAKAEDAGLDVLEGIAGLKST